MVYQVQVRTVIDSPTIECTFEVHLIGHFKIEMFEGRIRLQHQMFNMYCHHILTDSSQHT